MTKAKIGYCKQTTNRILFYLGFYYRETKTNLSVVCLAGKTFNNMKVHTRNSDISANSCLDHSHYSDSNSDSEKGHFYYKYKIFTLQ